MGYPEAQDGGPNPHGMKRSGLLSKTLSPLGFVAARNKRKEELPHG